MNISSCEAQPLPGGWRMADFSASATLRQLLPSVRLTTSSRRLNISSCEAQPLPGGWRMADFSASATLRQLLPSVRLTTSSRRKTRCGARGAFPRPLRCAPQPEPAPE